MGITHFSILNAQPNIELVAICDSSGFVLKNVAKYLDVEVFKDPVKMMDNAGLDFVVVATPTASHSKTVELAIENGLDVFVEKPLALNAEQGRQTLRLLEGKSLINQVGYVLRFNDVFVQVRHLLEKAVIGEVISFKMEMNGPTVLHGAKSSWRSKKTEGGGCLYDFASHGIDLINYLIGPPDEVIGTFFQSIYSAEVEDSISATLLYDSGARGNLLVNWSDPSYRKPSYRLEVFGCKGKIIADLHSYRLFLQSQCSFNGFSEGWNQRYVTDFFQPVQFYVRGYEFTRQLEHFTDCIVKGRQTDVCSFAQAHQTDIVIQQLRQDAERRPSYARKSGFRRQPVLRH
jgi:predicted dehydrogenase